MEYLQYFIIFLLNILNLLLVLNLVINGIPSIRIDEAIAGFGDTIVLNLVINGIPSILWRSS